MDETIECLEELLLLEDCGTSYKLSFSTAAAALGIGHGTIFRMGPVLLKETNSFQKEKFGYEVYISSFTVTNLSTAWWDSHKCRSVWIHSARETT